MNMGLKLYDYQKEALDKMKNGCILCGGVGSGKSLTSLAYYYIQQGGKIDPWERMDYENGQDLYIITTAKKRDSKEWEQELVPFLLSTDEQLGKVKVVIDSWNNIKKYTEIENGFFIFDEQRVVGYGAWTKAFLKIAKRNNWILLSATPGDTWLDYMPTFIANGFYKNKTEFTRDHVVYSRHTTFPKVDRYTNTERLNRLRRRILVNMDFHRKTESHHIDVCCNYDIDKYKEVMRNRWDPETLEPLPNAAALCYALRKITNKHYSRLETVKQIVEEKKRVIIFYCFDYELEILKMIPYDDDVEIAEWNGHKHQPIPESDKWVYLVNYNAGSEGWNCIKTDTIIFYSQNYSYRTMVQAAGRIDRLNTPYIDLYFYHLKTKASIDLAISRALRNKKKFNENRFVLNM